MVAYDNIKKHDRKVRSRITSDNVRDERTSIHFLYPADKSGDYDEIEIKGLIDFFLYQSDDPMNRKLSYQNGLQKQRYFNFTNIQSHDNCNPDDTNLTFYICQKS